MKKVMIFIIAICLLAGGAMAGDSAEVKPIKKTLVKLADTTKAATKADDSTAVKWITTKTGLQYVDNKIGEGEEAIKGKKVSIHYTGYLWVDGKRDKQFDSSIPRKQPLAFTVGAPGLIAGFTEGVTGMKVGGKRDVVIPPNLGYGKSGRPPVIPPNSTLLFEMELVSVK